MTWKLVPIEATEEMGRVSGMRDVFPVSCAAITQFAVNKWPDMLKAAPAPPDEVLERMARAFLDHVYAEIHPDLWDVKMVSAVEAMRAALAAAEERSDG